MGGLSLTGVQILFLAITAWLAVFAGTWCSSWRALTGVQPDLLPSLMVYAGLTRDIWTVAALSVFAGLAFDSLSMNPLGVSVLPLFFAGWCVNVNQDLILRKESYAQFVLGVAAGGLCPLASLLLITVFLGNRIEPPVLGWRTVWQLGCTSLCGGLAVALLFWASAAVRRGFVYEVVPDNRFRGDREMKRWKF
jgi:cell shape-determining protein MreD